MPQLPDTYAGSISEATLNSRHLIPRFCAVLAVADPDHPLVKEYAAVRDAVRTLTEWTGWDDPDEWAEDNGVWEAEHVEYFQEALFDALNEVAPEGTYFGSAEGDGASFGFWPMDDDEWEDESDG